MTAICVCFRHHPVHKSVEFGVQNALKRIFEDVYFQKFSEAYTTRGQNVYRVQFPMGWTFFAESLRASFAGYSKPPAKAQLYKWGLCNTSPLKPFLP